ncbi:MAG: Gfo/Idh/MocA family oxidoreductase, partial [Clostridiales bacterium]|nr:Gfo/Idh/MocA family oxidoreductase [Clostridiales bacterium]
MKLRAAIIGCGGISRCHMAGYKALADRVDVVACCDIDLPKAKRYAEEFGIPASAVYEDYSEMMAKESLDLVSVTTWNAA